MPDINSYMNKPLLYSRSVKPHFLSRGEVALFTKDFANHNPCVPKIER